MDDEITIVGTISSVLNSAGFATITAFDGQQGVDCGATLQTGCCHQRGVMPNVDELTAAEEIINFLPACSFLFISGSAHCEEVRIRAARLHNFGFAFELLQKPFDLAEVAAKIRTLVPSGARLTTDL